MHLKRYVHTPTTKTTTHTTLTNTSQSIRLKNQFRSLDDDEIDFLDKVLESTRAKEAAVKRETSEQLDYFRRQQEEAEKAAQAQNTDAVVPEVEEKWATGRKRKKGKEGEGAIKGLKLRKTSSVGSPPGPSGALSTGGTNEPTQAARAAVDTQEKSASPQAAKAAAPTKASPVPSMGLGLGDYSSDED